jgi:hypothetical protein
MVRITGTASSSENHRARPTPDTPHSTYTSGLELTFSGRGSDTAWSRQSCHRLCRFDTLLAHQKSSKVPLFGDACGTCQQLRSMTQLDQKACQVIRKPHKTQRSTGRPGKRLKAKRICGIRDWVISGQRAAERPIFGNHMSHSQPRFSKLLHQGGTKATPV